MAKYWGVDPDFVEEYLFVAKVSTFDEVEEAITEARMYVIEKNIHNTLLS